MTFRKGAVAAPSAARAMAEHLLEETLSPERLGVAEYYTRGLGVRPHHQLDAADAARLPGVGVVPTPRRDLHPRVAEILGLDPNAPPGVEAVANILGGLRADGGELQTNAAAGARSVAYIDLCFSAPKSVSLAWAFAETEAERGSILQAHKDAVDAALRYVAGEIGVARRGDGGRGGSEPGHIGWIAFEHYTSRPTVELARADPKTGVVETELHTVKVAGDPQLHTHCAVPNIVVTDAGHVGALDLAATRGRIHEFGATYQARLAANLRRIGVAVELDPRTGMARLPAVPERVCQEFSKRTRDAEGAARAEARRRGVDWDGLSPEGKIAFLKGGAGASRRGKADDMGDFAAWHAQAAALGWRHRSAVDPRGPAPAPARAERLARAYRAALPFLEAEFARRSVLAGADARAAAARGLIASGIEDAADIDAVTRAMRERGVRQDGRATALVWGREGERGEVRITTALHEAQEAELVRLARTAAADRSAALPREAIAAAVARSGLDFSGAHGAAQRAAIDRLGDAGRLAVAVGAAGSGKTTLLRPLVEVWTSEGSEVHGVALAWRQAEPLAEAGIARERCAALAPFLDRAARGEVALGPRSVVVLDELGQVGARQMLELLRLRERHGFRIVALGDDRQCAAIEAGPVVSLLRRALGEEAIPEIVTTRRQRTEREREIAGHFRAGRAAEALAMKRADGTAELVPGGYDAAVRRAAALWAERRAANHDDPSFSITVTAPTNADARAVAAAIREERRAMGELGPDLVTLRAADQAGAAYPLPLAVGDRVRLFGRANATFEGGTVGNIGNNGSVLEVRGIEAAGLRLRTAEGRVGLVRWETLADRDTGRVRLAHGDVLTVDAAQGLTSTEHINALPAGSAALGGAKGYVAESRHRERSWLVGSDGAERREAAERRMLGDPRPVTAEDAWENLARNLARRPEKESALDFLDRAREVGRGAARAMQGAFRGTEARAAEGRPATALAGRLGQRREAQAVAEAAARLRRALEARWEALRTLAGRLARAGEGAGVSARPEGQPSPREAAGTAEAMRDRAAAARRSAATARDAGPDHGPRPGVLRTAATRRQEARAVAAVADRLWIALAERGAALAGMGQGRGRVARDGHREASAGAPREDERRGDAPPRAFAAGEVEAAFAQALRRAGLRPPESVVMDGALRRVPVEGDRKGQRSGTYVGHLDGWPAGYIRNHRTGEEVRWKAEAPRALRPEERAALAQATAARATRRVALRSEEQRRAARLAHRLWAAARPAEMHPYLAAKGVSAHGLLRVDEKGNLLVPVQGVDGSLWGLQRIGADGSKLFLKGARTEGGHLLIGRLEAGTPLLVAEGYATGATLHAATGLPVAVAFNAHNLEAVARAYRAAYPARPIVVAGDDDRHLPLRTPPLPNVGRERAEAAAAAVGGVAALPSFAPGERGTDWNDLARRQGLEAVVAAIDAVLPKYERGVMLDRQQEQGMLQRNTPRTEQEQQGRRQSRGMRM
nr:MobF family relaxase [Roseicella sp. DB1501]